MELLDTDRHVAEGYIFFLWLLNYEIEQIRRRQALLLPTSDEEWHLGSSPGYRVSMPKISNLLDHFERVISVHGGELPPAPIGRDPKTLDFRIVPPTPRSPDDSEGSTPDSHGESRGNGVTSEKVLSFGVDPSGTAEALDGQSRTAEIQRLPATTQSTASESGSAAEGANGNVFERRERSWFCRFGFVSAEVFDDTNPRCKKGLYGYFYIAQMLAKPEVPFYTWELYPAAQKLMGLWPDQEGQRSSKEMDDDRLVATDNSYLYADKADWDMARQYERKLEDLKKREKSLAATVEGATVGDAQQRRDLENITKEIAAYKLTIAMLMEKSKHAKTMRTGVKRSIDKAISSLPHTLHLLQAHLHKHIKRVASLRTHCGYFPPEDRDQSKEKELWRVTYGE
jgi:hypothetical protein